MRCFCAAVLIFPALAFAQDVPPRTTENAVRLNVEAMPALKPALRHQLLPDLRELNPGNPVQAFMECLFDHRNLFTKEATLQRFKWDKIALKDLPVKEMRDHAKRISAHADFAARLNTPDWQELLRVKSSNEETPGGANNLSTLELGRILKVRLRAEIAESRFDEALVTLKTMFALSEVMSQRPSLMGNMVSVAVAALTIKPLEEMLEQPGCPNLFWALTYLPHPLLDLRKGLQAEKRFMSHWFDNLDEKAPMSEVQIQKLVDHYQLTLPPVVDASKWLTEKSTDPKYVDLVRNHLIEYGLNKNLVKQFPPAQVILLYEKIQNEITIDDSIKTLTLPYWQREPYVVNRKTKVNGAPFHLFEYYVLPRAAEGVIQLEENLALLRCIEAVRLYAAENNGKLPARLEDIRVPLPLNPVTGRPFQYRLEGHTAHLQGESVPGGNNPAFHTRYEITVRK